MLHERENDRSIYCDVKLLCSGTLTILHYLDYLKKAFIIEVLLLKNSVQMQNNILLKHGCLKKLATSDTFLSNLQPSAA
jgi:hypothetical protein